MTNRKKILIETLILPLAAGTVNILFFRHDPGFSSLFLFPYLLIPLFMAASSGIKTGYVTLLWEFIILTFLLPWLSRFFPDGQNSPSFWLETLNPALFLHLPLEMILILIFGRNYTSDKRRISEIRERLSELSRENHQLKKLDNAQAEVSRELEERVYRQQEAITTLYAMIQKMYTLDLELALENLLESVRLFSGADSLSFERLSDDGMNIVTVKTMGDEDDILPQTPINDSLEGWVLRNNRFFSIRMVLEYEHLSRLDQGRSVLIYPLQINRKPWGLINIHRMPFVKYNEYTEQLLEIIVHLAEMALTRAAEFDPLIHREEEETESGILRYPQFLQVLDEEMIRLRLGKSTFSFVILEILNLQDESVRPAVREILEIINGLTGGRKEVFHYKKPVQLAVLLPSVDEDGASLFCLELLERLSSPAAPRTAVQNHLEIVIGFAHTLPGDTAETIMERAESILQAQMETSR